MYSKHVPCAYVSTHTMFLYFHNIFCYLLSTFQNVNETGVNIYAIKSILNYGIPSFSTLYMDIAKKNQLKFVLSLFTYVFQ
jgi:hypothetical protein